MPDLSISNDFCWMETAQLHDHSRTATEVLHTVLLLRTSESCTRVSDGGAAAVNGLGLIMLNGGCYAETQASRAYASQSI